MAKLFLVRHGKSEWNKLGLWTGWTDVSLSPEGVEEARKAGEILKDEDVHTVYLSPLKRTHETFEKIKEGSGKFDIPPIIHDALNERSYGIHTGKNKWQVKEEIGEEEFMKIRRGWDTYIPEGETLKDVHDRAVPYYEETIKKDLIAGKNVLIAGHNNTFRALIKHLEGLDEVQVCDVDVGTDEVHCYSFDEEGKMTGKEVKGGGKPKV